MSESRSVLVPPGPAGTQIRTWSANRGRSLLASRTYAPGELIATFDQPLLALPDGAGMRNICNWCLQLRDDVHPLRACTACKAAVYCSRSCQRDHWNQVHKAECKAFGRVRARSGKDWLPTPVRAALQLLLRMKAGEAPVISAVGPDGFLLGNTNGFEARKTVWEDCGIQAMAAVVYGALGETQEAVNQARKVICKIQTNAFNMADPDSGKAGIFLDAVLAMVNHSCEPNAFVTFHRRTATLRALASIRDGDEIEISYIDQTLPRCARREALELYHFQCQCLRCAQDRHIYQVCADSTTIPLNSFSLVPSISVLQSPCINTALHKQLSAERLELLYKSWLENDDLGTKWRMCQPLVDARMFSVEPLPSTIRCAWDRVVKCGKAAHLLSLACFLSTQVDPYKYPAPFEPFRVKGLLVIARSLSQLAPYVAREDLDPISQHKGLSSALAKADLVSMCEAILRMIVHWGTMGSQEYILQDAQVMLRDIEGLDGRTRESALLQAWAANPAHQEGRSFFEKTVLVPIGHLAAFAVDILDLELLGASSLVRPEPVSRHLG